MNRVKALVPSLPRDAWWILGADGVGALGHGLILPFFIVYLHRVRGIELDVAAFAFSAQAIVGFIIGPIAGGLIDRVGPRRMLLASMVMTSSASALIVLIREPWHAFAVAGYLGVANAAFWPALQSLLGAVVRPAQRSNVFSMQFAILNAGIGIGALVGGAVADIDRPGTFESIYIVEAVLVLLATGVIAVTGAGRSGDASIQTSESTGQGNYRQVLKDRLFLRVLALQVFLVTVGYAQLESAFPAYATGEGGISTQALGIAFFFNTATIVVAQLVVLKKLVGRRRTRGLMVLFTLWATCWTMILLVGELATGTLAVAGFAFSMILFASGETLLSPTIPPIVNDLSPDHLRGRYNALYTLCWSAGLTIGPPIAGILLDRGLSRVLFVGLAGACVAGALMARRLEEHLPAEVNLVRPDDGPEITPQAGTPQPTRAEPEVVS